nr:MAG TPA: hypothetical protein [Caudoviricetes sp.]
MYETKVYDISIDHCLYWGMHHGYVHMCNLGLNMVVLGLTLYNRPQLRMVIPFGISKFFDVCSPL